MAQQIQFRRGTAAQWTSLNPILGQGEPGLETDTKKVKVGDGTTAWSSLTYSAGPNVLLSSATAGGDLSGTLPSPTVAKVNGVAVTGTPSSGQILAATGTTAAAWANATVLIDGGTPTSTFAPVPIGVSYLSVAQIAADPALTGTYADYKSLARNPDALIAGAVTRDSNGAATSATVTWPDGTMGTYTATSISTAFPGAVDAYTITYGSPATRTYTQSAVTRDATGGAVTNAPAITVI